MNFQILKKRHVWKLTRSVSLLVVVIFEASCNVMTETRIDDDVLQQSRGEWIISWRHAVGAAGKRRHNWRNKSRRDGQRGQQLTTFDHTTNVIAGWSSIMLMQGGRCVHVLLQYSSPSRPRRQFCRLCGRWVDGLRNPELWDWSVTNWVHYRRPLSPDWGSFFCCSADVWV